MTQNEGERRRFLRLRRNGFLSLLHQTSSEFEERLATRHIALLRLRWGTKPDRRSRPLSQRCHFLFRPGSVRPRSFALLRTLRKLQSAALREAAQASAQGPNLEPGSGFSKERSRVRCIRCMRCMRCVAGGVVAGRAVPPSVRRAATVLPGRLFRSPSPPLLSSLLLSSPLLFSPLLPSL